jgi:acetoin utilization protein AcuB
MVAKYLISLEVKPLTLEMTGKDAFSIQSDCHVKHLPVVSNEGKLLGIISEEDIFNHKLYEPISLYDFSFMRKSSVQLDDHLFEVMRIMGESNLSLIPVTDALGNYIGSVTLDIVMKQLSNTASIAEEGGIIVLDMPRRDYSLAEISRIVESEDTKIISATITSNNTDQHLELTLKLNRPDVFRVVAGLERRGYIVKETHVEDGYEDDSQDRFKEFMHYLDM